MTTERPGLYPYHDVNNTNVTNPEDSLFLYSGYPAGLKVPSSDHNGKFRRAGFWFEYLDRNGITNYDWLDDTTKAALSSTSLTYETGENVLGAGATVASRGVYLINGTRIETDTAFLSRPGLDVQGDKLKYVGATAPGRIWIYADADGQPRYESVAAGVADSPEANEITLVGVDIDVNGKVTDGAVEPVTLALPDLHLPVAVPVRMTYDSADVPALQIANASGVGLEVASGGASISGPVGVTGDVSLGSDASVAGVVTGKLRHRSHTSATSWIQNTVRTQVSGAASGTVPPGGGAAVTIDLTVNSSPTSGQILLYDSSVYVLDLTVIISDGDATNAYTQRTSTSWWKSPGNMLKLGDEDTGGLVDTVGDVTFALAGSTGQLQLLFNGGAALEGTTLRCAYYATAYVMPIT